jgi:hypothetical protein
MRVFVNHNLQSHQIARGEEIGRENGAEDDDDDA